MAVDFEDSKLLKDIFGIFTSCRRSFDLIHAELPHFISNYLVRKHSLDECPAEQDCSNLWVALGVDPEIIDMLAATRLTWNTG